MGSNFGRCQRNLTESKNEWDNDCLTANFRYFSFGLMFLMMLLLRLLMHLLMLSLFILLLIVLLWLMKLLLQLLLFASFLTCFDNFKYRSFTLLRVPISSVSVTKLLTLSPIIGLSASISGTIVLTT